MSRHVDPPKENRYEREEDRLNADGRHDVVVAILSRIAALLEESNRVAMVALDRVRQEGDWIRRQWPREHSPTASLYIPNGVSRHTAALFSKAVLSGSEDDHVDTAALQAVLDAYAAAIRRSPCDSKERSSSTSPGAPSPRWVD